MQCSPASGRRAPAPACCSTCKHRLEGGAAFNTPCTVACSSWAPRKWIGDNQRLLSSVSQRLGTLPVAQRWAPPAAASPSAGGRRRCERRPTARSAAPRSRWRPARTAHSSCVRMAPGAANINLLTMRCCVSGEVCGGGEGCRFLSLCSPFLQPVCVREAVSAAVPAPSVGRHRGRLQCAHPAVAQHGHAITDAERSDVVCRVSHRLLPAAWWAVSQADMHAIQTGKANLMTSVPRGPKLAVRYRKSYAMQSQHANQLYRCG